MDIKPQIGEKIKYRRQQLNMTQDDLARKFGVTKQTISRYESGDRGLGADDLERMGQILRVPIGYFYGDAKAIEDVAVQDAKAMVEEAKATIEKFAPTVESPKIEKKTSPQKTQVPEKRNIPELEHIPVEDAEFIAFYTGEADEDAKRAIRHVGMSFRELQRRARKQREAGYPDLTGDEEEE